MTAGLGTGAAAGELRPLGSFVWTAPDTAFGGFSGLEMRPGGDGFYAVSDRGVLFEADVGRRDGRLTQIEITGRHVLRERNGQPPRPFLANAEALALGPDGVFHVAYEGWARVWSYDTLTGPPRWRHAWDRFWALNGNHGFEALALDPMGRLLVVPEADRDRSATVWRLEGDDWVEAFAIPLADGYLVSGADFAPDGSLFVVTRKFSFLFGFSTRIRRLELDTSGIRTDTRVLDDTDGALANSEGISLWRDAQARTIATVISDDNFSRFQSTILSEFVYLP